MDINKALTVFDFVLKPKLEPVDINENEYEENSSNRNLERQISQKQDHNNKTNRLINRISSTSSNNSIPQNVGNVIRDPRIRLDSVDSINNTVRKGFLEKELSAQDVINQVAKSRKTDSRSSTSTSTSRSKTVNDRLSQNMPLNFAYMPRDLQSNTLSIPNISPLIQSKHNSIYSFQISSDNVKTNAIEGNPYSNIPLETQNIGKRIGADLATFSPGSKNEAPIPPPSRKRRISTSPIIMENVNLSPSITVSEPIKESKKKMIDKETQTTKNTASLYFELSSNNLIGLSFEKKKILREFMEAFDIEDSLKIRDIKERNEHRVANGHSRERVNMSRNPSPPRSSSSSQSRYRLSCGPP